MTREQKALAIYDHLRQAHASIKQIWAENSDLADTPDDELRWWESAIDTVDGALYLAEGLFVKASNQ